MKAAQLYGNPEQAAVSDAWRQVGIDVGAASVPKGWVAHLGRGSREGDTLAELQVQIAELTKLVQGLTKQARRKEKA